MIKFYCLHVYHFKTDINIKPSLCTMSFILIDQIENEYHLN